MKGEEMERVIFISGKQKTRCLNSKSMQAFLVTVPNLYQVKGKTVLPGKSLQSTTKTGYLLRSEPQTLRQALISIDVILQVPFTKRGEKD